MPFTIIRNDIAKMNTDAMLMQPIPGLRWGAGYAGYSEQRAAELQAACDKLAPIKTGGNDTPGFRLAAKYIVQPVPFIMAEPGGKPSSFRLFNSLKLAVENNCRAYLFP